MVGVGWMARSSFPLRHTDTSWSCELVYAEEGRQLCVTLDRGGGENPGGSPLQVQVVSLQQMEKVRRTRILIYSTGHPYRVWKFPCFGLHAASVPFSASAPLKHTSWLILSPQTFPYRPRTNIPRVHYYFSLACVRGKKGRLFLRGLTIPLRFWPISSEHTHRLVLLTLRGPRVDIIINAAAP